MRSSGISLNFTGFPQNLAQQFTPSLALQQIPCHSSPQESQLLHSPSTLLQLKQKELLHTRMLITIKSLRPHYTYKFYKKFCPRQDWRNYASTCLFKQLSSFSQACHFVHQNMGHSVRLWVYNCHCFQLADQSEQTLGLSLWQCI